MANTKEGAQRGWQKFNTDERQERMAKVRQSRWLNTTEEDRRAHALKMVKARIEKRHA